MLNDEQIVNELKHGNTQPLEDIYRAFRRDFVRWAVSKFNIDAEIAEDIFSDTVIDVYQNIVREKYIKNANTTLKSYLFEVGKYKILNVINKNKLSETHLKIMAQNSEKTYLITEQKGFTEMINKINELLIMIDEKCRKVLTLFYYHNLSMEQIALEMNFKNQDVAKNKKLKCIKKLQSLAFGRYSSEDFYD